VRAQPVISTEQSSLTEGEELVLTCNASFSIPPPVFKWTKNGVQLANSSGGIIIINTMAAGGNEFYIYSSEVILGGAQLSDSGDYRCQVTQNDPRLRAPLSTLSEDFNISISSKFYFKTTRLTSKMGVL